MMWWCSPNITQFPFTSPGTGQHLICWFYTCKNNCCLLVAQQSISGESGGKERGGGVNSLIPQSPNTPLPNRKVNILTSAWGRQAENPTLCRSSTHSMEQKEWDTILALGHFPHYPSLSCLGLLCHKLEANTSSPFFCMGCQFFPSILSESSSSHIRL